MYFQKQKSLHDLWKSELSADFWTIKKGVFICTLFIKWSKLLVMHLIKVSKAKKTFTRMAIIFSTVGAYMNDLILQCVKIFLNSWRKQKVWGWYQTFPALLWDSLCLCDCQTQSPGSEKTYINNNYLIQHTMSISVSKYLELFCA